MKTIANIWILLSAVCGLYFAWQWYSTQNPQYEPKLAILSGISTLVALWVKSEGKRIANSAFFIGNRNKISQNNRAKDKENKTGFWGSENEVNQK